MRPDRYALAKRVTAIGAIINAFLGLVKVICGKLFVSQALIADGIHSLSDLITDIMVLIASKYGSQAADCSHPYGHERIETAATLILSQVLILTGFGIAWSALDSLLYTVNVFPNRLALPIVLLSIIANEILFHYTYHAGKTIHSDLLIANAWHRRSDAASSLVVAIGIIGSLLGFKQLDSLAAIVVGVMIIKMGIAYGWNSVKELVDTAPEDERLRQIKDTISAVDGVCKIHQLRGRNMGKDIFIDVHILVSPYLSVSEGHYIAQRVHHRLIEEVEYVKDVTIHVDPEDDELECPSLHLPSRKIIEEALGITMLKIDKLIIHYLNGYIYLDILSNRIHANEEKAFLQALRENLAVFPKIKQLCLLKDQIIDQS